jgi:hypothetical protein
VPNFSVPAGDTVELLIPLAVDPVAGTRATWALYAAAFANPYTPVIVVKDSALHHGSGHGGVSIIASPPQLAVLLTMADTAALIGNYYWVTSLNDPAGHVTTAASGILTVTLSALAILPPSSASYDNRPFQSWMTVPVYYGGGLRQVTATMWLGSPTGPPWGR